MSTRNLYLQLGSGQTILNVGFDFIDRSYVRVIPRTQAQREAGLNFSEDDVLTDTVDYNWLSDGQIELATAADGTTDYLVERVTPRDPLVTQQPGVFSSEKANLAVQQALDISEEQDTDLDDGDSRSLKVPYGEVAPPLSSLASANGQVLGFINGRGVPVENTGAAAPQVASDRAFVQEARDEVAANAAQVALDTQTVEGLTVSAVAGGDLYLAKQLGVEAVAEGGQFLTLEASEVKLYEDVGGEAVERASYPTSSKLESLERNLTAQNYDTIAQAQAAFFVNTQSGSDAGTGADINDPYLTTEQARTSAATDDLIALFRGQIYPRGATEISQQDFISYGTAATYAVMDARQSLEDNVWTDNGDGTWSTQFSMAEDFVSGGEGSNTFNFGLWWQGEFGQWQVGGADIAANQATLAALPLGEFGFEVNVNGDTNEDVRDATPTTGPFNLRVKMPDESDPNGKGLLVSNYRQVLRSNGKTYRGIEFIGGHAKDHVNIDDYSTVTDFVDCKFTDFGEHSGVGPANLTRVVTMGQARPGSGNNRLYNKQGTGYNFFTTTYRDDLVLVINGFRAENCSKGAYGHGSGNQGYKMLLIEGEPFICVNTQSMIDTDTAGGGLALPFFQDGVLATAPIYGFEVDQLADVCGPWRLLGGGHVEGAENNVTGNSNKMIKMNGAQSSLHLRGFTFYNKKDNGLTFSNILCERTSDASFDDPTLILEDCHDLSPNAKRFRWPRGASPANIEHTNLILTGGSQFWDLADAAGRTNFPMYLRVDAGCQFGWGNRTGPDLETALDAAGVVHEISGQATIVGINNQVLSGPGWK